MNDINSSQVTIVIPCGLVARIRRSHRRGRGSIPRTGGNILPRKGELRFLYPVFMQNVKS